MWDAITAPAQVIRWWGELTANMRSGGDFQLRWLNEEAEKQSAGWRGALTEFDPPRVLETSGIWGHNDEPWGANDAIPRFALTPDGDGTILRFTNTLARMPDEFRTKVPTGWHWQLDSLADVLDGGREPNLNDMDSWTHIHAGYEEKYAGVS